MLQTFASDCTINSHCLVCFLHDRNGTIRTSRLSCQSFTRTFQGHYLQSGTDHLKKRRIAWSMWSMWFVYFMHINKLYSVYSNLFAYTGLNDTSLVVNRVEVGLHFHLRSKIRKTLDVSRLLNVWRYEYIVFPINITRLNWDGSYIPEYRRY